MPGGQVLLGFFIGVGFFAIVFDLVRRGKLREEFSAFWFPVALAIPLLALFPRIVEHVAWVFDVNHTANMIFILGFVFLMTMNVYLSVRLSNVLKKIRDLTQSIALLHRSEQGFPEVGETMAPRESSDRALHSAPSGKRIEEAEAQGVAGHVVG
jgi:hypothetical protein